MREPKRVLQKLLGPKMEVATFAETGEPLEQIIATFRDVVKCRKVRGYVLEQFGFDLAISPAVFYGLLNIPQINYVETTKRDLEVETISLQENREPDDPVTISNLNSVLRELYAGLFKIKERIRNDYPNAVLIKEMRPQHIDRVHQLTRTIAALHGNLTGYLFTGRKARRVEKELLSLFPKSDKAHPLRNTFPLIEHELELYREVFALQKKWEPLGLDLFAVLRKDDAHGLNLLLENIQELGNRLWQIIYQSSAIRKCVDIAGIDFGNIQPLFDNDKVNLTTTG